MRSVSIQRLGSLLLLGLCLLLPARQAAPQDEPDANTAVLMAFADAEAMRDYEAMAALLAEDFVCHSVASDTTTGGQQIDSPEAYVQLLRATAQRFPDYRNTPVILVADEHYVAFYNSFIGHVGQTNIAVEMPIVGIARIEAGKIAEMWVEWDNLSWHAQMGMLPTSEPAAWREGKDGDDLQTPPHSCSDADLVGNWGAWHPHG